VNNQYQIPQTNKEKVRSALSKVLTIVVLFAALAIFIFSGAAAWLMKTVAGQPVAPEAVSENPVKQLIAQGVEWTFSQASDEERTELICQFGTTTYCDLAQKRGILVKYPAVTYSDLVIVDKVDEDVFDEVAYETWELQFKLGGDYQPDFNDSFWSNDEKQRWADTFKVSWTPTMENSLYTAYVLLQKEPEGEWRFSHILTGKESMRYVTDSIPNIKSTLDAAIKKSTPTP
jgi:hypothetical protein